MTTRKLSENDLHIQLQVEALVHDNESLKNDVTLNLEIDKTMHKESAMRDTLQGLEVSNQKFFLDETISNTQLLFAMLQTANAKLAAVIETLGLIEDGYGGYELP